MSCVWMLQRGHSGDGCVLALEVLEVLIFIMFLITHTLIKKRCCLV